MSNQNLSQDLTGYCRNEWRNSVHTVPGASLLADRHLPNHHSSPKSIQILKRSARPGFAPHSSLSSPAPSTCSGPLESLPRALLLVLHTALHVTDGHPQLRRGSMQLVEEAGQLCLWVLVEECGAPLGHGGDKQASASMQCDNLEV